MALQLDVTQVLTARDVDDAECTIAVANINSFSGGVVTDIVSVIGQLYALVEMERVSSEHLDRPALSACHENLLEFRYKKDALRLV